MKVGIDAIAVRRVAHDLVSRSWFTIATEKGLELYFYRSRRWNRDVAPLMESSTDGPIVEERFWHILDRG